MCKDSLPLNHPKCFSKGSSSQVKEINVDSDWSDGADKFSIIAALTVVSVAR